MVVYFLINALHSAGGTERVTTLLANELSKQYEVGIISLHNGGTPFFALNGSVNVVYLNNCAQTNIYTGYFSNIIKLRKVLKQRKVDVVIDVCSAMSLMSIPATRCTHCRVVTWEHFNANVNWNKITSPAARKLAAVFSSCIVVLTNSDKRVFEQRFKARRVLTIPNPITIESASPSTLTQKVVLAVGRFETQKGFDLLVQAWQKCKCRKNGWSLRIIGEGSQKNLIEQSIKNLQLEDSVTIDAPTNNITDAYRNSSIYAMSSRFEGLPLVLIEAMSMGLPAVSFDCETGPRDIISNNETGYLVKPNDTEELAIAIDKLAENPYILHTFAEESIKQSKKFEITPILQKWTEQVLK